MKVVSLILFAVFSYFGFGCSDISRNAEDLKVEFSWGDMKPCGMGIPEIAVTGLPENTKYLVVRMYDHAYLWDHGKIKVAYNGSNIITEEVLEGIEKPCPPDVPGRYKVTVKALDENETVIGVGSKERYFPEKK